MEQLNVPYWNAGPEISMREISGRLNEQEPHTIGNLLWPVAPYKPDVSFSIAYSDDSILLKFFVRETSLRVTCFNDNEAVYQDSCVEFFIAFDKDGPYYNLEFNCIGICQFGFGPSRTDREEIAKDVLSKIKRQAVIENSIEEGGTMCNWSLTLAIPFEVFTHHRITSLKGMQCRANFYKCGDALPIPHFLSWQNIESETPNFHLPEFFGSLQFV